MPKFEYATLVDSAGNVLAHVTAELEKSESPGGKEEWRGTLWPLSWEDRDALRDLEQEEYVLRLPGGGEGGILVTGSQSEAGGSGVRQIVTVVGSGGAPF